MILAQRAIELPNTREAAEILDRHRPDPGQPDLRGWEWRYLWQFCQSDALYELGRHDGVIRELSLSSDGRLLCVNGEQDVALWDLFTRREIEPSWQDTEVTAAAFAPHTNLMAISWKDEDGGGVALVNPFAPVPWRRMEGTDQPKRLRFTPDGKQLLGLRADWWLPTVLGYPLQRLRRTPDARPLTSGAQPAVTPFHSGGDIAVVATP